jgi:hypothetical protein
VVEATTDGGAPSSGVAVIERGMGGRQRSADGQLPLTVPLSSVSV